MSEPKFKIGETVVITEVDSLVYSKYIGRVGIVVKCYYKGFTENGRNYQVRVLDGKKQKVCYANVREATEMDKALEGL